MNKKEENNQEEKKMGRPTIYTEELCLEICKRIANGESLRSVCRDDNMPHRTTIHEWLLDKNKQDFIDQYERAVNARTENMFDELVDIADDKGEDADVQRDRLRVDTRKWYLSKVMPKKYGDKLDLTSQGEQLPAPIVSLNEICGDNSTTQDSETE